MQNIFESPLVNVLLFSIFWALEIFVTKLAFNNGAQVIPFTIQSSFVTLLILIVYIFLTKLKELKKLSFHTIKWLLLANAIHMGLGTFLGNAGIQLTTAINAGFLSQFTVVAGTLLAWIILSEKMTFSKVVSIGIIILGSFLLTTKGQFIIPHSGDLLILLACVAWSLGGVIIRKMLKNTTVNADLVSLFRPIAGIPVLLLFVLLSPLYPTSVRGIFQVNIFQIHQLFYVLLNASIVALVWIFVNRTLKYASASYAAIFPSITPILVTLLALAFLGEGVGPIQIIGMVLILASSFMAQYLQFYNH